ncbi:MAG: GntR family transcriptional regulator [Microbacterium sp.]|uniref:GntR family transcriptional regulator n=1 Tax=Microbacterium sp. TaxID=51671 RepID=UPI0039E23767
MEESNSDVYDAIRTAILRGDYAPRQRLGAAELAETFGTSRFVVRSALLQLVGERLVEFQPNRGARVRELTLDEALEIIDLREIIEGLIAARAAERITDDQITELRGLAEAMETAIKDLNITEYARLNDGLHQRLREIAEHETADRMLEQLNARVVRNQFHMAVDSNSPHVGLPQHLAIIDAVCSRDAARSERLMRDHIGDVRDQLAAQAKTG